MSNSSTFTPDVSHGDVYSSVRAKFLLEKATHGVERTSVLRLTEQFSPRMTHRRETCKVSATRTSQRGAGHALPHPALAHRLGHSKLPTDVGALAGGPHNTFAGPGGVGVSAKDGAACRGKTARTGSATLRLQNRKFLRRPARGALRAGGLHGGGYLRE